MATYCGEEAVEPVRTSQQMADTPQACLRRKVSFASNVSQVKSERSRVQSDRASDFSSYQSGSFLPPKDEWWDEPVPDHCGACLAMREKNYIRNAWSGVVSILVIYIATIFLYRLCFLEFHIPDEMGNDDPVWNIVEEVVNALFWVDLIANFFMTYRDPQGKEVDSLRLIAWNYLTGYFAMNLIACIPDSAFQSIIGALQGATGDESNPQFSAGKIVRITRIQRISRLTRLARLARLVKIASFRPTNHLWAWLQGLRGVRVVNNAIGLLWIVHCLACGWYLCAALEDDPAETWVGRRNLDSAGEVTLLSAPPLVQWCHSFYFVLTVFTTVGFGDMSAVTTSEIVYVCFTMVVGAVMHSIIISEVISIVTSVDQTSAFVNQRVELIESFAKHTELNDDMQMLMSDWVKFNAKGWMNIQYDREEMKQLITGKYMPRWLLGKLPETLFSGRLLQNQYFSVCREVSMLPPRLPLLLALTVHRHQFEAGEIVYQRNDVPFNIYLVLEGTFANVARPTPLGGSDKECRFKSKDMERTATMDLYPYQLFSHKSYFGDVEVMQAKPRSSTARCESNGGAVLALHKRDFWQLVEEFPQFGASWRSVAARRYIQRLRLLKRLKCGMTHRHFAASKIQHFIRAQKRRCCRPERRCITAKSSLAKSATLMTSANFIEGGSKTPASAQAMPSRELQEIRAGIDALHLKLDALQHQDKPFPYLGVQAQAQAKATGSALQGSAYCRRQGWI